MRTLTISDSLMEFLEQQASKGGFANANDYLQSLILEAQNTARTAAVKEKLLEALQQKPVPLTPEFFQDLKTQVRQRSPELGAE
jgi:Arc/MetJ-type ribon-helix-helix transcriptional regulator